MPGGSRTTSLVTVKAYVDAIEDIIRSLGFTGPRYFVDQDTGTDSAETTGTYEDPWATPDYGWGRITANQGAVLVILPSTSVYDGNVNVGGILCDKAGTAMIMPTNRLVDLVNSIAGATAVITISADNITVIGGYISETTATVEGVVITSDNVHIYDMECVGTMELGIRITAGNSCVLRGNSINGVSGDGIRLAGASTLNRLIENIISGTVGDDGIELGVGCDENWLIDNTCHNIFATGISVGGDNNIIRGGYVSDCAHAILDGGLFNVWDVPVDVVLKGSFNRLAGSGTTEITGDIDAIDLPSSGGYEIVFDLNTLVIAAEGGTFTMRLYQLIGDVTGRIVDLSTFLVGTDVVHPSVSHSFEGGPSRMRVTHQVSVAVTANRNIIYKIIQER